MIEEFLNLLIRATGQVEGPYFRVALADMPDPVYLERVYCYELYHQLRLLIEDLPEDHPFRTTFVLNAEIDKQRHLFIEPHAPDFVFHVPGSMARNLAVIEVKRMDVTPQRIADDVATLEHFLSDGRYQIGIELVFGPEQREGDLEKFREAVRTAENERLRLLWHSAVGTSAEQTLP